MLLVLLLRLGTIWWVEHVDVDGVDLDSKGLDAGKDFLDLLDNARDRFTALTTDVFATIATLYIASNARSARCTAEAAIRSSEASERTAQAAVRTAAAAEGGLVGIADDEPAMRQTCIDVLCACLRLPDDYPHCWFGYDFDFRGTRFTGGTVSFCDTRFSSGRIDFDAAATVPLAGVVGPGVQDKREILNGDWIILQYDRTMIVGLKSSANSRSVFGIAVEPGERGIRFLALVCSPWWTRGLPSCPEAKGNSRERRENEPFRRSAEYQHTVRAAVRRRGPGTCGRVRRGCTGSGENGGPLAGAQGISAGGEHG